MARSCWSPTVADLDRHVPVELGVPSTVDLAHPVLADLCGDFIRAEASTRDKSHGLKLVDPTLDRPGFPVILRAFNFVLFCVLHPTSILSSLSSLVWLSQALGKRPRLSLHLPASFPGEP